MFGLFGGGRWLDSVFRIGTIGIHLVVSTFVGLIIGYYLDKYLDTKPWLLLIFLLLGIAAGFKNLYSETKRVLSEKDKDKDQGGPDVGDDKPKT